MSRNITNYLKNRKTIFNMSITAVFAAISIVVTAFGAIPIVNGQGYFNFGDLFTFVIAALVHPLIGGAVGGLSGLIADLMAGYGTYAPFTLVIKFIMGVASGYLFRLLVKFNKPTKLHLTWKSVVSFIIGGLIMAFLYMCADFIMFDQNTAFVNVGFNVLQGTLNAIIGCVIFVALFAVKDVIIKTPTSEKVKGGTELDGHDQN